MGGSSRGTSVKCIDADPVGKRLMVQRFSDSASTILLDIEGTTTPIDFVFGVLFPFARDHLDAFLAKQGHQPEVQADLRQLRQEYEADLAQGEEIPPWQGSDPAAAIAYIQHLIATDRKSTGLKSLQGKIWQQGYKSGELRSRLFPDVKPAFQRWVAAGKRLHIFSSGSVPAQKLLFRYTEVGDLTPFLSGYFDTRTGPKQVTDSYYTIAGGIGVAPAAILFISDVTAELKAARAAGLQTLFSMRPGNRSFDAEGFAAIQTFDGV